MDSSLQLSIFAQTLGMASPFRGTVSRDFLLLVSFHESDSPQPQSIPLGPF